MRGYFFYKQIHNNKYFLRNRLRGFLKKLGDFMRGEKARLFAMSGL